MAEKEAEKPAGKEPEFIIQRLYIKDSSFEAPNSPQIFLEEWRPELNMDLATKTHALGDDNHEVILTVNVTVKIKDKTVFLVETHQAGIFTIRHFPAEQLRPMLGSFCPTILYPYAREAVTDLVIRGGFPQLYLAPVNFDALFAQHEKQDQTGDGDKGRVH
ncbi:MAG: protein-export chaperone SecB [Coxiella sp. RIFCSPHIGHO2_12_FULL_44_14]|nr:MAG: protein-export chaperone SecB [Coxiella sp. RIFCSPHIGHO2_12_FULL_44_14]